MTNSTVPEAIIMTHSLSRRQFMATSAAAGVGMGDEYGQGVWGDMGRRCGAYGVYGWVGIGGGVEWWGMWWVLNRARI